MKHAVLHKNVCERMCGLDSGHGSVAVSCIHFKKSTGFRKTDGILWLANKLLTPFNVRICLFGL